MNKPKLHVVSLSGGKDSTAMLLMMVERHMPIDLILFCDTGLEFPAIYEHINKVEKYIGIPITRIKSDLSFEYYLLEHKPSRRYDTKLTELYGKDRIGYGWVGPRMRWCTSRLKTDVIDGYLKELTHTYSIEHYIGIAADETNRIKDKHYPLVEWGVTEKQALEYCYSKGFDFGGLYELFDRVSCWCCPLQGLKELRILRKEYPELWRQLLDWDSRTWRKYRADFSVAQLETRFAYEDELTAQGKPFFIELRNKLKSQ